MFDIPLAFAFSAGLVAAFNPCGAAMFPAYVGYQLDASTVDSNPLMAGGRAILMGLAATAGFIAVFGAVGLALAAGGRVIGEFLPFAGLGVGVAIAALGVWLLVSGRKLGILAAGRVNLGGGRGLRQVFLFGIAYAVASLSCALPIFLAAVGIAFGQSLSAGGALNTIIGSIAYGVGMGAIMVAATIGIVFFKSVVTRWMRKIFPLVEKIGNVAMILAGGYLIYYWTIGDSGRELLTYRLESLVGG